MAGEILDRNKDLVRNFLAALSSGKVDRVLILLDDDMEYWVAGRGPMSGVYSKAGFKELYTGFCALFPTPLTLTLISLIAEGNRVACEAESYGKTSAGKFYQNAYHLMFEIGVDKIFKVREYMDTAHAAEVFAA